jgi:GT2 family glycosyltransferase
VLVTTRDRRDELRRTLASAFGQRAVSEVLVVDDGSTDGTAEMVEREFPGVRLIRSGEARGYIAQRNRGVRLATAPVVVIVDDDAVFSTPATVEQTLADFDHPCVGAVAIPHLDVGVRGGARPRRAAAGDALVTSEFVGTAVALRRDAFLEVGGFRESFFHQGEERDFCLRLLATGRVVRVGRADPIHHHPSPVRDVHRMDLYGRRNTILCAFWNEPFPAVVARMAEMTAQGLVSGLTVRRPLAAVHGLGLGYRTCWRERRQRRPVPRDVGRLFRRLWKAGPLPLQTVEPLLPANGGGAR